MEIEKQTILGITGTIGSGKSVVSRVLSLYSIPVFDSDSEAKALYRTSQELQIYLRSQFGEKVFLDSGEVDKAYIASIVFSDKKKLSDLEQVVHPLLRIRFQEWCNEQKTSLVALESAILFQTHYDELCDIIFWVTASREERIERVMRRDEISRETVKTRLLHQLEKPPYSFSEKLIQIDNSRGVRLFPQIERFVESLGGR